MSPRVKSCWPHATASRRLYSVHRVPGVLRQVRAGRGLVRVLQSVKASFPTAKVRKALHGPWRHSFTRTSRNQSSSGPRRARHRVRPDARGRPGRPRHGHHREGAVRGLRRRPRGHQPRRRGHGVRVRRVHRIVCNVRTTPLHELAAALPQARGSLISQGVPDRRAMGAGCNPQDDSGGGCYPHVCPPA